MIPFVSAITNSKDLQNLNDAVQRVFLSLLPNPLLNSPQIVQNVSMVSGADTWVDHRLGRLPIGYLVIKANAAVQVFTSPSTNILPTARICLKANATATVDILFF